MSNEDLDQLSDGKALWILFKRKAKRLFDKYANFLRIHIAYFIVMIFIGTALFYGIEGGRYGFVDCFFTMTSAMTVTGLIVIDTSQLTTGGQVLILIYIWLGSFIWMSLLPLLFRLQYFRQEVKKNCAFVQSQGKKMTDPAIVLTGDARLEYLSIIYMIRIVLLYLAGLLVTCFLALCIYFWSSEYGRSVLEERGLNLYWYITFNTFSTCVNAGFSQLSDSMIPFKKSPAILLIMSFFILAGLTAFPVALRIILLILRRIAPTNEIFHFMITHPRQVYTLLFPRRQAGWLFLTLVLLNSVQLVIFELISFNKPLLAGLTQIEKIVNGIFQTFSTRTAGYNSVDLSATTEALRIMWLAVMYIAAYPVTLSIRTSRVPKNRKGHVKSVTPTTVIGSAVQNAVEGKKKVPVDNNFEDLATHIKVINARTSADTKRQSSLFHRGGGMTRSQSLTLPVRKKGQDDESPNEREVFITKTAHSEATNFKNQVKNIVLRDVSWLLLAWFVISLIENDRVSESGDINFTESRVLFEIISAFGNVGLSLGYPNTVTSFSGVWRDPAKLVIVAVMLLGRHRGLPDSIDRAITGMSPKTLKRAQGGAGHTEGATIDDRHLADIRGPETTNAEEIPMHEISVPDHVIQIEEDSTKGPTERVKDELKPEISPDPGQSVLEQSDLMQSLPGDLIKFVADRAVIVAEKDPPGDD